MQIPVYDSTGEVTGQLDVSDDIFDVPFNENLVHQALLRQLANKRQGTASTKTRSEVKGSTGKFYRQKGTGRARRGSLKSPLLRGGGVVFGPRPRSYRQRMPKKMRDLALRCALSSKVREGKLRALEELGLEMPKTKDMAQLLGALNANRSTLILTSGSKPTVVKSVQNLPNVKVLPASLVNAVDLLSYDTLVATVAALRNIEEIWEPEAAKHASI
jgi:large subunit ribosomal protein L4